MLGSDISAMPRFSMLFLKQAISPVYVLTILLSVTLYILYFVHYSCNYFVSLQVILVV